MGKFLLLLSFLIAGVIITKEPPSYSQKNEVKKVSSDTLQDQLHYTYDIASIQSDLLKDARSISLKQTELKTSLNKLQNDNKYLKNSVDELRKDLKEATTIIDTITIASVDTVLVKSIEPKKRGFLKRVLGIK